MPSVSEFLIERLENIGIKCVFGVVGDYILNFIQQLSQHEKLKFINTTDEANAAFAADVYARVQGIGCVCATYSVGALKLCNAVAGAYAEKSPLIVISGSPGLKERNDDFLLHHVVQSFDNQFNIFKHITCHSVLLDDPTTAGLKIDGAIESLRHYKQPIYIELPRDIAEKSISYDVYKQGTPQDGPSDEENLKEALNEAKSWILEAKSPVIMAGVQVARFGLGSQLARFAEKYNIPMVTTLLSKSTINEHHPLFAGVYCGRQSCEGVRKLVDESDCLMIFGEMLTDMMMGFETPKFNKRQVIISCIEGLKIKNHAYSDVKFLDFCTNLFKFDFNKKEYILPEKKNLEKFVPQNNTKITTKRFFEKINDSLNEKTAVIADVGDCLFGALELQVNHNHFISSAFYGSMGLAIPGALGFQLAKPNIRPIVLVGDGAFQMSMTELSTILQNKLSPIIFVLNNRGYTTERILLDGKFNDIRNWDYHKVTELICGGVGIKVETEEELEEAIKLAFSTPNLVIINISIDPKDLSPALRNLCK